MEPDEFGLDFKHPFTAFSNPRKTPDGQIVLEVMHDGEPAYFVASPWDTHAKYGPLIFYAALAGKFGPLGEMPEEGF